MKQQLSDTRRTTLFHFQKPVCVFLFAIFISLAGYGQTSTQNFGTGTATQTSATGSTAIIPNPTSGTTWARGGAVVPNAPINVANTSNPLGTTGSYVRAVASSSTSVAKFSPWVNYTSGTEFYTSFKVLFGDASAGNTATSGLWNFYQGAGAMYSDASDFTGAQVFTGLRFTFGAGGAITLTYRAAGAFVNTGLSTTTLSSATVYTIEIVGNNRTSGAISYTYNGISQTVAVQKFDLYVNGTKIGDDLAEALLPANTAISSGTFIGISSTANVANIFVDDAVTYNAVPAAIGVGPTSATLANITQPSGSITQGTNDNVLSGFTVTSPDNVNFTNVTVSGTGTATSADIANVRIYRDNNGDGIINGADASVSGAGSAYSGTMGFTISGETGITSIRNYLIVADVTGVGFSTAGRTVTASITSGNFLTTAFTNSGSATGNSRLIAPPVGTPSITVTGTPLSTFNTTTGTPSSFQKDTVSGSDLTGDISVKPPAAFEVSLNGTTWVAFPDSIVLLQTGGSVSATPIFVRFNPVVSGASSGNIIHRSNGASQISVPVSGNSIGPLSYAVTGSIYTQDFDGLPQSGPITPGGAGPFYLSASPVNAAGTIGWQFGATASSARFDFDNGTKTTGSTYSYGTTSASDRALGSLAGTVVSNLGAVITNNTSDVLTTVTIAYTGEEWRRGSASANTLSFSYSVGGASISSGTFTPVPVLNFTSPNTAGTDIVLNGNATGNRTVIAPQTITLNANWLPGQNLVLRWDDVNDGGNDDGIAIDDFSFSAIPSAAPTLQDSSISFSNVSTFSLTANWLNGNGTGRIVVMNTSNSFTNPVDGTSPVANSNYTGSGQQVIYNGTGSSVNVTGLVPGTTYHFRVFGYNGSGISSKFSTVTALNNPNSQATVAAAPPTQLIVTSVNGGVTPFTTGSFYIVVHSLDGSNNPQNAISNTNLSITLANGFGTPGGTLTGTLLAGTYIDTIFGITYTTEDFGVILTVSATSGDALTPANTPAFDVASVATQLTFSGVPPSGIINSVVSTFNVQALKDNATVDVNYTGDITISIALGPGGNMTGTLTRAAVAGVATFDDIQFDQAGSYYLEADAQDLASASTGEIIITNVPTFTELVVPKYIGSKTSASANSNRTPIAVCLRLDNLVPNAAYDVRAGLDADTSSSTSYGVGNTWSGTAYNTSVIQNIFTTDGSGSSGPFWIYIEPSANTTRYFAGQVHNLRLGYVQHGGTIPIAPNFVGSKTITALDIQSTASTSTADDGAFLTGAGASCVSGKYILIYDNVAGTGDPLYSYQARQTTPSDTATANFSSSTMPGPVRNIFLQNGSSNIGDWAAVIPIGANNANGVQRVEARNSNNTIFSVATDADGVWPGGANTTNVGRLGLRSLTLSDATLSTIVITNISSTPASCAGTNDGTASVSATGSGLLSYSWNSSPVQTTATATGLGAGTYTVTISDVGGCSVTASATITQPSISVISASGPTTFCMNDSVTLSVPAGADHYSWSSNPATDTLSSVVIHTSGSYTVTVTTGSCVQTSSPVIVTVNNFAFNGPIFSENIGAGTGTTLVNNYTGWQNVAPITFASTSTTQSDVRSTNASPTGSGFSGGGNVFFTTSGARNFIISGINSLGYSGLQLVVGLRRDAGTSSDPFVVEVSSDGINYSPLTITQPAVNNVWSFDTASGVIPAAANLRIRFSKSGTSSSYRLDDIKLMPTPPDVIVTQPTCLVSTGTITVTAPTGIGMTYSIDGSTYTNSTGIFNGIAPGSYGVTAKTASGCISLTRSVTIDPPPAPLVINSSSTPATCNGGADGTATANPITGTSPFTYSWAPSGGTSITATGLLAGTYVVTVTDNNGCSGTSSVTVSQPSPIVVSSYSPDNGCPGDEIIISGSGLTGATAVQFGAIGASFIVNNDNQVTATVPVGATTNAITVFNGTCSGTGPIFTLNSCGANKTLNLKVLIEGFYNQSTGLMNATIDPFNFPNLCDTISVLLIDSLNLNVIVTMDTKVISTQGLGTFTFDSSLFTAGHKYYIVIHHRSSIETWSKDPQPFDSNVVTFDFTTP